MTPPFRTQTSFIALLNIIIIIIIIVTIIVSNHDAAASATFVGSSSCSFVSKRNKPSIHHQDHIMTMMGKRYQGSKSNNKKKQSIESLLELETDLHDRGYKYVIGSDDSGGAGCIAGPVVVASCCVLRPYSSLFSDIIISPLTESSTESDIKIPQSDIDTLSQVNDCKVLTTTQRQEVYDVITRHREVFAITTAERSASQIDDLNLLRATQQAFAESIETLVEQHELPYEKCYAIVDGNISPKLYADLREEESDMLTQQAFTKRFSVRPYVNGDANVFVVALASIVARITRDHMMREVHDLHPEYNFDINNGYGSKSHIEILHRLGSLEGVHRRTFKQVAGR